MIINNLRPQIDGLSFTWNSQASYDTDNFFIPGHPADRWIDRILFSDMESQQKINGRVAENLKKALSFNRARCFHAFLTTQSEEGQIDDDEMEQHSRTGGKSFFGGITNHLFCHAYGSDGANHSKTGKTGEKTALGDHGQALFGQS
ncbi:MAG: hypothetical protein HQL67_02315 [Magnetococcales bacterium]|nr:hypothetical protein [Magnetococcales bacterium]